MNGFWQLVTALLMLVAWIVYHPATWVIVAILAFIIGYRIGH